MNRIKLTTLLVSLTISFVVAAVEQPERKCDNRASAIASSMNLPDNDAVRFEQTYQAYQKELQECFRRYPDITVDDRSTDDRIDSMIRNQFAKSKAIIALREKYYPIWQQFLSQQQIRKMYDAERQLKKRMAEERFRRHIRKGNNGIVPHNIESQITTYMSRHFPGYNIISFSRQSPHSQSNVVINDGTVLVFSKKGKILSISASEGCVLDRELLESVMNEKAYKTLVNKGLHDKTKSIAFKRASYGITTEGAAGSSTVIINSTGESR